MKLFLNSQMDKIIYLNCFIKNVCFDKGCIGDKPKLKQKYTMAILLKL